MANALQTFHPFHFSPTWNMCPIYEPMLDVEQHIYGTCGTNVLKSSCGHCCSSDGYCTTDPKYCGAPRCLYPFEFLCQALKWPPGFNTSSTPRPTLGNVPYGKTVKHCTVKGTIALTFDDGPSKWTPDLLDILKTNNVKATFFIRALNLLQDLNNRTNHGLPTTLRRMHAEGHQIAGHTWSHKHMDKQLTSQERREEMIKAEIALTKVLGFFPTYMRPPFNACGAKCQAEMGVLGYHVTSYDIDSNDWRKNYTEARQNFRDMISRSSAADGAWLSLAHDTLEGSVHGYAQFTIDESRKQGYKLVTVGECLDDAKENWYRDPVTGLAWAGGVASPDGVREE